MDPYPYPADERLRRENLIQAERKALSLLDAAGLIVPGRSALYLIRTIECWDQTPRSRS